MNSTCAFSPPSPPLPPPPLPTSGSTHPPTAAGTPLSSTIVPRCSDKVGVEGGVAWLLDSYERACNEEKYSSKHFTGPERKAVLLLCKGNCISHCALVLSEVEYFDPTFTPPPDM